MKGDTCINCTVVELKQNIRNRSQKRKNGINCTVVELKHIVHRKKRWSTSSINCTVVELKPLNPESHPCLFYVLIVPLWN